MKRWGGRDTLQVVLGGACARCGESVDLALSPVRVIGGRVRAVCVTCVDAPAVVHAVEAPPRRRMPRTTTVTPLSRRWSPPAYAVAIAGLLVAGALAAWAGAPAGTNTPAASTARASEVDDRAEASRDVAEPDDDHRFTIGAPEELDPDGEELLTERFPSLADWVHPVIAPEVLLPDRPSRHFGAARDGERPVECGRGHCGVDLFNPQGALVVAVAFGVVTRIIDDPDRRSGRYVMVQHPEGAETSYMHLDSIADGLTRGQEVEPGQVLGTLGRSGVGKSAAHLHFSLAIPIGNERMRYVDPLPFLETATPLEAAVDAP